ncbi:MAG: TIGR00266 family protein [Candidatus Hydrothermarchaeota archaeon]
MEYEVLYRPSFSLLKIKLNKGESITAEAGAMVHMTPTIEIETHMRGGGGLGGLLKSLKTSFLGGESFWTNTFHARENGEIALTGPHIGDIEAIELNNEGLIIQSGSYIANTPGIDIDTSWQGWKGFLGESDIIMLRASGTGIVWVSSFGGIEKKELKPGEKLIVDTGHVVAFSDTMNYTVRRVGGLKSTVLSGEGLVFEFTGPGQIQLQTRQLPEFARSLIPFLPIGKD